MFLMSTSALGVLQAFYPGAMSNKLYELATSSKMFATLPDTDHSGENRGRVNFGTKWAISSGGQLLSLVVLLQQMQMWMEVIKPGSEARTYIALVAGLGALVLKFPEVQQMCAHEYSIHELLHHAFCTILQCSCVLRPVCFPAHTRCRILCSLSATTTSFSFN